MFSNVHVRRFSETEIFNNLNKVTGDKNNVFLAAVNKHVTDSIPGLMELMSDNILETTILKHSLAEIDTLLLTVSKSVLTRLISGDVGGYGIFKPEDISVALYDKSLSATIKDNVAYGVVTTVSQTVLNSMTYFFRKEFIFHYIRDSIVEVVYKDVLTKVLEEAQTKSVPEINRQSKVTLISDIKRVIKEFVDLNNYKNGMMLLKVIADNPNKDLIIEILGECRIVPDFIHNGLVLNKDVSEDALAFTTSMDKSWSIKTIRKVYMNHLSSSLNNKVIGSVLENKLLINDLKEYQVMDGCTTEENIVLGKILMSQDINDSKDVIDNNILLSNINSIITHTYKRGTRFKINNTDMLLTQHSKAGVEIASYSVTDVETTKLISKDDPLLILFGDKRDLAQSLLTTDPSRFIGNQTVTTKREHSLMLMSKGQTKLPITMTDSIRHREYMFARLMGKFRRKKVLMTDVDKLMRGQFEVLKYNSLHQFTNKIVETEELQLLHMAEMIGINKKIEVYNKEREVKKIKEV